MSIRLIKVNKKCNTCKSNQSFKWHLDRWGRIGWVCHNCFNGIKYGEKSIREPKRCNTCKSKETSTVWHRDKWGIKGWICHDCFNSITYREQRTFSGIITRNRPSGLVYNIKK